MSSKANSTKKIKLANDFERMIPEYHSNTLIYGEHIVRYISAASLLKNKVVLDIASGSGYGTKILSKNAKKVFGVDISKESVEYASQNYFAKNIEFIAGDGIDIPIDDNTIDVVVSFETIEHIQDYRHFMSEIKRVLKDDGLLIISTPNDLEFAEGNHFHIHEFKQKELKNLTEEYFKYNTSYFQGTWNYTALLEEKSICNEFIKPMKTYNYAPLDPKKFLYFFMLCSNREITEKIEEVSVISEHYSDRKIQEKEQLTQKHINNLQDQLVSAKEYVNKQASETHRLEQRIIDLEEEQKNYLGYKMRVAIKKMRK